MSEEEKAPSLEVRAGWVEFNCVQYRDATEAEILAQPCVQEALKKAREEALADAARYLNERACGLRDSVERVEDEWQEDAANDFDDAARAIRAL